MFYSREEECDLIKTDNQKQRQEDKRRKGERVMYLKLDIDVSIINLNLNTLIMAYWEVWDILQCDYFFQ